MTSTAARRVCVTGAAGKAGRAAVRELTGAGVSFLRYDGLNQDAQGVWTTPGGDKVAWFHDPDGNVLSLTQFKLP